MGIIIVTLEQYTRRMFPNNPLTVQHSSQALMSSSLHYILEKR